MDREEIKNRIDLDNIQEKELVLFNWKSLPDKDGNITEGSETIKQDYLVDYDGNYILPINLIECVLIEEIKGLKARIKILEEVKE